MKAFAVASGLAVLATAVVARAQFSAFGSFICPVSQIGQPCNQASGGAGMCVPAECEVTANQANDAGGDVNVPVSCAECGACVGRYCSETVACAPPNHCFTGGLQGQGMGTPENPDMYLVFYQNTWCAPWLDDAGCGPFDPPLLSQFPPWQPCSGVNPPSDGHCSTSWGAGAAGESDASAGGVTKVDATAGVTGGFDATAPFAADAGSAAEQASGSGESTAAEASTEDAAAPPRVQLVLGRGACALGIGRTPGGGLLAVGIAAALGLLRKRPVGRKKPERSSVPRRLPGRPRWRRCRGCPAGTRN